MCDREKKEITASAATTSDGMPLGYSQHQLDRMIEDAGHHFTLGQAGGLIRVHDASGKGTDGRPWYWGPVDRKTVFLTLSALPTMTAMGLKRMIRSMHIKRRPPDD